MEHVTLYMYMYTYSAVLFTHKTTTHCWQVLFTFQNLSKGLERSNYAMFLNINLKIVTDKYHGESDSRKTSLDVLRSLTGLL